MYKLVCETSLGELATIEEPSLKSVLKNIFSNNLHLVSIIDFSVQLTTPDGRIPFKTVQEVIQHIQTILNEDGDVVVGPKYKLMFLNSALSGDEPGTHYVTTRSDDLEQLANIAKRITDVDMTRRKFTRLLAHDDTVLAIGVDAIVDFVRMGTELPEREISEPELSNKIVVDIHAELCKLEILIQKEDLDTAQQIVTVLKYLTKGE